jgi:hypothetical protein
MVCVEVNLDGSLFRRAGIQDASLITPIVSGFVGDDTPARLDLSGMCELGGERAAHVYWAPPQLALRSGSVATFRLTTCESPSPPEDLVPIDSPAYLAEQREFEALKKSLVPDPAPSARVFPELAFHCRLNHERVTVARLKPNEEHILCSIFWGKWHPDRLEVSITSFGLDSPKTEWLRKDLAVGDELEIRVAA